MDATQGLSKAQRIRKLGAQGHTTREIAKLVYGLSESTSYAELSKRQCYVRVALRQRKDGQFSDIDRRYALRKFGSIKAFQDHRNKQTRDYYKDRRQNDAEFRARQNAWKRTSYRKKKAAAFKQAALEALQRLERVRPQL